ncbi:MAG: sigma-70 family RNA polymerase sigma factor [Burkholderiales bacterium]
MYNKRKLIDEFTDNYATLSKFAIMIVKDKDAALDVMQNVALVIVTKGNHVSEIKKPTAFFLTCIRRAALNYLRDESRTYPTDPVILEESNSGEYSRAAMDYLEWVMMLDKYLESYSQQIQNAFIKHYVDGYPLDMVAKELNMTPNALSQQFRRIRKRLAQKSPEYRVLLIILSFM